MKKILILYTSHTMGHKVIAENIGYYLSEAGCEVRLEDILKVQAGGLVTLTSKFHYFVNKYLPFVWRWLYTNKWFTDQTLKYRLKFAAKNHLATLRLIEEFNPDIVITTQTAASGVAAFLKQEKLFSGKFGIAFSDFHLHRYWLYDQADFYLVNVEEQKQEMVNFGVPSDKIFVVGMTLKPKRLVEALSAKQKFNIGPNDKVVLMSAGSFGFGLNEDLLYELNQKPNIKVIVVTGNNKLQSEKLSAQFGGTNVIVLGFYTPMDDLYAIANLFITKPGGLSVAEGLSWNLPMMVLYMLPGQEELNYNYLSERGLIMPEPIAAAGDILEELEQKSFRKSLRTNPAVSMIASRPEIIVAAVNQI